MVRSQSASVYKKPTPWIMFDPLFSLGFRPPPISVAWELSFRGSEESL